MMKTALEIAWVAVPKVAGGALTLGLNILLLRVWSPEAYGAFALCTTLVLLVDAILGSALDLSTVRLASGQGPDRSEDARGIERAALQFKLVASAATLPVVVVLAQPAADALFGFSGGGLLVATFGAAVALLLLRSMLVHAQLSQRFQAYGMLEALHAAVKFGGIAGFLALTVDPGVGVVLAMFLIGPATAFAAGLVLFRDAALWPSALDFGRITRLLRYARWYALSGAAGNLLGRLDLFMLSALASAREVGLLAGAHTFAGILWLVASYLSVVLSPRIMPLLEQGSYRSFHRRVQPLLYVLAAVILVVALALVDAPWLSLFPASFRESADLLRILLPGAAMSFATFPLALPLVMFRRPRFTFIVDCAFAPVIGLSYWLAIASHGAEGAAWVTTLSLIVRGSIVQAYAWHLSCIPPEPGEAGAADLIGGERRP